MTKQKLLMLFILLLITFLLFYTGAKVNIKVEDFLDTVRNFGVVAPLVFVAAYALSPIFFIPIIPLSITGGILFGPVYGTLYSIFGATMGGCVAFLISRYLIKEYIDKKLSLKILLIKERTEKEGWRFIVLARIMPFFPFSVQNYLFGVTNIPIKTYFWASMIGSIPGTFCYVYLGYAGKNILQGNTNSIIFVASVFIILTLITIFPYVYKRKITQNG